MERFWSKVVKGDGCWEWSAAHYPNGYGSFGLNGRQHGAHRIAYQLAVGLIPQGMVVMHSCDNKGCVRPDHLSLGTPSQNAHDAALRGLYATGDGHYARLHPERLARGDHNGMRTHPESRPYGERQGRSKLREADVRSIRQQVTEGRSQRELARHYGVSRGTIGFIVKRQTWVHI